VPTSAIEPVTPRGNLGRRSGSRRFGRIDSLIHVMGGFAGGKKRRRY